MCHVYCQEDIDILDLPVYTPAQLNPLLPRPQSQAELELEEEGDFSIVK